MQNVQEFSNTATMLVHHGVVMSILEMIPSVSILPVLLERYFREVLESTVLNKKHKV